MRAVKSKAGPQWNPDRYLNREASWLQFDRRVLEEARNPKNPLLDRVRFLAIFESNLDEFYMVRVSGLIEQYEGGITDLSPDGLTPSEQLDVISEEARPLRALAGETWAEMLRPALEEQGVRILAWEDLSERQRGDLEDYFRTELFPLCSPIILDPKPTVPFVSNRSFNLAVLAQDDTGVTVLSRVKIPDSVPRVIRVSSRRHEYVLMEDVIRHNVANLFPGVRILAAKLFRVIRDADVEIRELEAGDLIETVEKTLKLRRFGDPVLLEIEQGMPSEVRRTLMRLLKLDDGDVFEIDGLMALSGLYELAAIDRPSLRFRPAKPHLSEELGTASRIFAKVREQDVFLHHPFDSFRTVEEFIASASQDAEVLGIKQTLYRVGQPSPVVEALLAAAEERKQVAAMVELKARFDEDNNLNWARTLERAGVHVSYGFMELKVHCKLCLVVRREHGRIRTYAHIGTGNYNPSTARLYTDFGLLTSDPEICQDVAELFNYLTGFSRQREYRKLLVAPINLRDGLLWRIHREIDQFRATGQGRILMKMNSLVDPEMVDALYAASTAGVPVDLIVRGICCLRPGLAGLSENIRVMSVVGRFLEHSRAMYFENGGEPELYIGSADLMRRNLDRRVEVLTPIEDKKLIAYVRDEILEPYWRDNTNAWDLQGDGTYVRREAEGRPFTVQEHFLQEPATEVLYG